MKKLFITIFAILGMQSNFACSAKQPDDDAARGVQSLWNASNQRRDIFTAEGDVEAHTKANAKTPDINNRIAKATVSDRQATDVETARILSAVIAGEIIAHANSTEAALCYDQAIAFDPTHRLYGHHTVLKLTQEITRSCINGGYKFNTFIFSKADKANLNTLKSLTKHVDEKFFTAILHNAYYSHYTCIGKGTLELGWVFDETSRGAVLVAGGEGTPEGENAKQELLDAHYDDTAVFYNKYVWITPQDIPARISTFLQNHGLAEKYNSMDPKEALQ